MYLFEQTIEKYKLLKQFIRQRGFEYIWKQDLSKDELESQISVLEKTLRVVLLFVAINLIRIVATFIRRRAFSK